MDRELIERLAKACGIDVHADTLCRYEGWNEPMERFAALIAEECIGKVQSEVDHAAINEHSMAPDFGRATPVPAIRRANVEAALDALRAKFSL